LQSEAAPPFTERINGLTSFRAGIILSDKKVIIIFKGYLFNIPPTGKVKDAPQK